LLFALILSRFCRKKSASDEDLLKLQRQHKNVMRQFAQDCSSNTPMESSDMSAKVPCADKNEGFEYVNRIVGASTVKKKEFAKGDRVFVGGRLATITYGPDNENEYMATFDDNGRQTPFITSEAIEKAGLLQLEAHPANGHNALIVSNISAGNVAFRVKTNSPDDYRAASSRNLATRRNPGGANHWRQQRCCLLCYGHASQQQLC